MWWTGNLCMSNISKSTWCEFCFYKHTEEEEGTVLLQMPRHSRRFGMWRTLWKPLSSLWEENLERPFLGISSGKEKFSSDVWRGMTLWGATSTSLVKKPLERILLPPPLPVGIHTAAWNVKMTVLCWRDCENNRGTGHIPWLLYNWTKETWHSLPMRISVLFSTEWISKSTSAFATLPSTPPKLAQIQTGSLGSADPCLRSDRQTFLWTSVCFISSPTLKWFPHKYHCLQLYTHPSVNSGWLVSWGIVLQVLFPKTGKTCLTRGKNICNPTSLLMVLERLSICNLAVADSHIVLNHSLSQSWFIEQVIISCLIPTIFYDS